MDSKKDLYHNNNAFTIIEILIVIMILAVLTAITAPQFNSYQQNLQLKTKVEQLLSNIRYVQQQSIITGLKHGIVFDINSDCYYLLKDKSNPQILEKVDLAPLEITEVNFPIYHSIPCSGASIFYKSLGYLDHRNGRVKLKLNKYSQEIVFSSNAGEINIR